jgi:hypothetical protein
VQSSRDGGAGILILSAAVLLVVGGAGLFAARETATWLGAPEAGPTSVIIQIAASAMLGLAVMNWLLCKNRIGGIYARPLCLANLLFFASSALCAGKAVAAKQLPETWLALVSGFSALTLAFLWLAFLHDPLAEPVAQN